MIECNEREGACTVQFLVTLEPDETGYWVADCPALPGCLAKKPHLRYRTCESEVAVPRAGHGRKRWKTSGHQLRPTFLIPCGSSIPCSTLEWLRQRTTANFHITTTIDRILPGGILLERLGTLDTRRTCSDISMDWMFQQLSHRPSNWSPSEIVRHRSHCSSLMPVSHITLGKLTIDRFLSVF